MSRIKRIAVLGCSAIAKRSVIPAILKSGRFDLAYAASRSKEKGGEFAKLFGCAPCSYDDIVEKKDIDAVYVSLPVGLHGEWGEKIVESGKHLLMEKTFTSDAAQGRRIVSLAEKRRVVAMEALVYVYHPVYQRIQSLIRSGDIGRIRRLEASFGFPYMPDQDIRNVWDLGGGAMLDVLIYPLSFCLNTVGEPVRSLTASIVCDKGRGVDCRGFVQMNWDHCSAHVSYGFGFMYRNACSVWAERAILSVERIFSRPPDMKGEIWISRQGRQEKIDVPAADHFELMLKAFADKMDGALPESASGVNEKDDILYRLEMISKMRAAFIQNGLQSTEWAFRS